MIESLPLELPEVSSDFDSVFLQFEQLIEEFSADLGSSRVMAHMDPPTPKIAAQIAGLNAAYNQNLLHPDLSPLATKIEERIVAWLSPFFGMNDGHFCAGSTIANLTAIWCAREHGAKRVIASQDAHISVPKAAHILGIEFNSVPVDVNGRMQIDDLSDVEDACLVLTAGTTGRGVVDRLTPNSALWTHVDAAWAGPLRLTKHAHILDGIGNADSVAISAHKWFYQPKDSALVLFANRKSRQKISYGSSYLATPNVGVQGSRGAAAVPLMATLMLWGRAGLANRIEKNMSDAVKLAEFLHLHEGIELKQMPETAVVNWRPKNKCIERVLAALGESSSRTQINNEVWVRQVAANPSADVDLIASIIRDAVEH
jgi:L-2,4-diaminobutyrate decarboxylase